MSLDLYIDSKKKLILDKATVKNYPPEEEDLDYHIKTYNCFEAETKIGNCEVAINLKNNSSNTASLPGSTVVNKGNYSSCQAFGDDSVAICTGDGSAVFLNSHGKSVGVNTGDNSLTISERGAVVVNTGDESIVDSGSNISVITGYKSALTTTKSSIIASNGNNNQICSGSDSATVVVSGRDSIISNFGDDAILVSSGFSNKITSGAQNTITICGGHNSRAHVHGDNNIAINYGENCGVSGSIGTHLILIEWEYDSFNNTRSIIGIDYANVDGINILPNQLYTLKDGKVTLIPE